MMATLAFNELSCSEIITVERLTFEFLNEMLSSYETLLPRTQPLECFS